MNKSEYDQIVSRMIEAAGHLTRSFGIGRALGQLYACLYFSREPQSLNDLTRELGISKGSASMGARQLEQWGAVAKVWVKGDRKDYYRANDAFGRIIKNAIKDLAGKRMERSSTLMDEVEAELSPAPAGGGTAATDDAFTRAQIQKMRAFQKKAQGLWDGVLLRMLLK
ncbi:MAG: hypothetical protein QME60_00780 [Verrucomicrobiota bacterium]|nr:hypothetical protein [Verrucomicrobiota bacterium]